MPPPRSCGSTSGGRPAASVTDPGDLLVKDGLLPDVVHTSLLRRAIRTAQLTLDAGGGLSDEDVVGLNVPTGIPLCYELDDKTMRATRPATYLDPEGAAVAIEAVANQGKG